MEKHSPTHRKTYGRTGEREDCLATAHRWAGYADRFGIERCNDAAESIVGGLRYSTRTAVLIAANDGDGFGAYLFRTAGGRYFAVRVNWPMRDDMSHPLDVLSTDAALRMYGELAERVKYGATVDPIAEAFPGVTVEDA